jgi:hypothetical protein
MAKKITECKERYCCLPQDLQILELKKAVGLNRFQLEKLDRFCKHCGQEFEYYRYMDAAGSMDWDYRPKKAV